MLTPRLTNCIICADIPSLLRDIECQLVIFAKRYYNNITLSLNLPTDPNSMFDLLNYKRILTYKYCNSEYASNYTVNMIASKVKLLTAGCKNPCYSADLPIVITTTTTTSTSTTTTSTSTTSITSTTSSTTSTTAIPRCEYNGGSIIIAPTTTTTTTSSTSSTSSTSTTSTTSTTTTVSPIIEEYGYLYNWFTGSDLRNLANDGWHVPIDNDFRDLRLYISPGSDSQNNDVGGNLKAIGTTYWNSPNTGAIDDYNFNMRASGQRGVTGYQEFGEKCTLWASDDFFNAGRCCVAHYNNDDFWAGSIGTTPKTVGACYRLKKDTTTISADGTVIVGGYIGNDGQVYDTVVIDNYEWTQSNIKETRYRNNDLIPIVQDNTWFSLTSGARCYYIIP